MEQAGKTASRAVSNSQPSTSEPGLPAEVRRRAAAVWEGMKQLYGLSFVTIYGEIPTPVWVGKIATLTDAECRAGLTRLAEHQREYPANLTEFFEACKPKRPVRYLGVPSSPGQLRIGPVPATEEQRARHLASIRLKLGRVGRLNPPREREPGEDDELPAPGQTPADGLR